MNEIKDIKLAVAIANKRAVIDREDKVIYTVKGDFTEEFRIASAKENVTNIVKTVRYSRPDNDRPVFPVDGDGEPGLKSAKKKKRVEGKPGVID
jgi:hypothetical protein